LQPFSYFERLAVSSKLSALPRVGVCSVHANQEGHACIQSIQAEVLNFSQLQKVQVHLDASLAEINDACKTRLPVYVAPSAFTYIRFINIIIITKNMLIHVQQK
jgi:hypothetical protein